MPKRNWTPPDAGNAPQEVKDILARVYSAFRDKNPAENAATKARGAKIAWGAVKNAGWRKDKDGKWIKSLKESDVQGSFDDIRSKVSAAIQASTLFPTGDFAGQVVSSPWIRDMFDTYCIVSYDGDLYQVDYAIVADNVVLGTPIEVITTYIPVTESVNEKKKTEATKESNFKITDIRESGISMDLDVATFISLKEAKWNDETSEVEVVLIEAGTNPQKKRHYPVATIQEAAPGFAGLKMYINHPTSTEEKERPERNLRDWASTIVESKFENGKAIGRVAIHDSWLRERLKDPVAREHIGLSINTGGKVSMGKVNGTDMQIVEKIVFARQKGPASVDWVTEAGARGRMSRLLESRTEGRKVELEIATLKDLKESRTDLIEAINKEATAGHADKVSKLEKDLKESNDKIAAFEKSSKTAAQATIVEASLKESKMPDAAKDKVRDHFKTTLVEGSENDLKEAIVKVMKTELEYVNKLSTKGTIKTGEGAPADLKESLGVELDARAGIKKEEKK